MSNHTKRSAGKGALFRMAATAGMMFISSSIGQAFELYNEGCNDCHGAFTGATSTKGSIFPSDSKHEMHNGTDYMNTECNLCHSSGDRKDPFIGFSDGTANNQGLGCTGCHSAFGLRAHHAANSVTSCAICHPDDGTPPNENVDPPYYNTVDTKAARACNNVPASNTNENWTVGDLIGLDNDGDNLYDLADFDCGPYEVVGLTVEGSNVRVTWRTAGGRRDVLQTASVLGGGFSDLGSAVQIEGVGIVVTNILEVGGATSSNRFYRIRYAP